MFRFKLAFDDWTPEILDKMVALNTINLLDESDPAYEFASNLSIRNDMTTVVCHGSKNSLSTKIYKDGELFEREGIGILDLAQELKDNSDNDCIILFACSTGEATLKSPAQQLANHSGKMVWAPIDTLWVHPDIERFYINAYKLKGSDLDCSEILDYSFQKEMWKCFVPFVRG